MCLKNYDSIHPPLAPHDVPADINECTTSGVLTNEEVVIASGQSGLSTLQSGASFGRSVVDLGDLDEDGVVDLAVGAMFDGVGGAVYILFMNDEDTVRAEVRIDSTHIALSSGDQFGFSVATVGDLDGDGVVDLAVGARSDDDGGTSNGAVYIVFLNRNGSMKQYHKISSGPGGDLEGVIGSGSLFGHSVEIGRAHV